MLFFSFELSKGSVYFYIHNKKNIKSYSSNGRALESAPTRHEGVFRQSLSAPPQLSCSPENSFPWCFTLVEKAS